MLFNRFIFKELDFNVTPELSLAVDLNQDLNAPEPVKLNLLELKKLYANKDVPGHRFAFAEVQELIDRPAPGEQLMAPGFKGIFAGLDLDLNDIITSILSGDGNTSFEELECVGFDPNFSVLVGTLRIKKPYGYLGGLCHTGSKEYVTFWADFDDNGTFETCLGTTSVNVYDIEDIPDEGLEYSIFLPVDLSQYRKPCEDGPKVVRIRAILSWQTVPPCFNPHFKPFWGNREETLILVPPGPVFVPGDFKPLIESVGNVATCHINQVNGMANSERPFGGVITVKGFIPNPPDALSPNPLKYRVSVRERPFVLPPGPWQPLDNSFKINITEQIGAGIPVQYTDVQAIDPVDGFYTYREDPNGAGSGWRLVQGRVLARWITAAPMTDRWEIKVEAKDPVTNTIFDTRTILCPADGSFRKYIKVRLDEIIPTVALQITGFSSGGGPVQPATDCATFQKGDVIHGTYSAGDEHFGFLTLRVEPVGPAGGVNVNPPSRVFGPPDFVPTIGEPGNWTLDTSVMDPCGYVVRLRVADRTIVNSNGAIRWKNGASVGFCLVEQSE